VDRRAAPGGGRRPRERAERGLLSALLLLLAVAFAVSIGAHYTGACMGMPHALGAISARGALIAMAPLALAGAALASHGVERTVAGRLTSAPLGLDGELGVLSVAFLLTTAYNRLRIPTSTIQILVFSLLGVALGAGGGVRWGRVGELAIVWAAAPPAACGLGFALTRLLDRLAQESAGRHPPDGARAHPPDAAPGRRPDGARAAHPDGARARRPTPRSPHASVTLAALIAVGLGASFAMGANDVANATGALLGAHVLSAGGAGAVGGAALALGVLAFGRRLLGRVAFEIVAVDASMAAAAQAVQAVVVLAAVAFGLFTSMNQALVGAMAGAGAARGAQTVRRGTLAGILRGWLLGPAAGLAGGLIAGALLTAAGGRIA